MQAAGPNELGYANTALITALLDLLVQRGFLSAADCKIVATRAVDGLKPDRSMMSVNGAINFIETAIVPQIGKRGAA